MANRQDIGSHAADQNPRRTPTDEAAPEMTDTVRGRADDEDDEFDEADDDLEDLDNEDADTEEDNY